ncbi:aminopeptidase N [endosymbiont of Riftia pachyptila (vent Ph05)]|uniref:Aminopeptidase N n=2 Tax=endosymbiont of Riftia pachyptila TaxID=54396 RepID=G2DAX6_9GAMM|nr:aminopeptidase N [endosymbiont of Riftia pachyptila (vent Ph05)]
MCFRYLPVTSGLHNWGKLMRSDNPNTIYLKDYQPPAFFIEQIDLSFDLFDSHTLVESRLQLRRNPQREAEPLVLDGEQLELLSLQLDDRPLAAEEYRVGATSLTIDQVPDSFELKCRVRILPQQNTALEGLYQSGSMFCTQCEAEGFRRITYFLDRPDVMSRFTTSITAKRSAYPVLLSNGNLVAEELLEDGRHRVRWEDPFPKPCYLFALVAGDLRDIRDSYTTASGREVDLRIYVEPENIDKCEHAMRSLKNAMRWDEQHYGREYDLDIYMIVAVNDFNMGAMENKGLNVFNSKYVLARPDTATDQDFQGIEGVIAHEYFHNWTGNRITCRDWFQLSLKEGLTVFRDQEFSADMGSRGVKRIEDVRLLRAHQFAEDAGPMAHPVRPDSYIEINNFYTVTVYEKGAEVVRMQAHLLGPEGYRKATDLYFERHDGQAVTTDDFVKCMEDASGRHLEQFRHWYRYAGTPVLEVDESYDAASQRYSLTISQHCPDTPGQRNKPPFHIPVAIGLLDAQGNDLPLQLAGEVAPVGTQRVLELRDQIETFHFVGIPERPVPSLLRGGSAPVKLEMALSDPVLMFRMAHDSDGFNRWDAAQLLAQRLILKMVEQRAAGAQMEVPAGFIDAFRQTLVSADEDQALLAQVLSLPAEGYLGDQMEEVDVEGVHAARERLRQQLAESLHDELVALVEANREQGEYRIEPADIGRRSLRNLALHYLMAAGSEQALQLCLAQYQAGHNMTDVLAALALLAASDAPQRTEALADFESRWRDDPLVMDKWFAVQAMAPRADTLETVQGLMSHPVFSMRNPNKVRGLIGTFCGANPIQFHRADGAGYRFLADRVLELDPLNPQVAARLLRLMSRWRRYDGARQALMKGQFERVLQQPGLSRDLFEIAEKSLEAGQ